MILQHTDIDTENTRLVTTDDEGALLTSDTRPSSFPDNLISETKQ